MHNDISLAAAVNPARLAICPRCEGRGTVTFTRPGGWLKERCSVCRGECRVDPETAETVRTLQRHAEAALGPVDGRCCNPAEEGGEPCVSCQPPDLFPDEPFMPSEADEADYRAWCREREVRLWEERIAADEAAAWKAQCRAEDNARLAAAVFAALQADTFQEMLASMANAFADHGVADVRFVGGTIGTAFDLARHLEATSAEQYIDRRQAMLDCVEWSKS